MIRNNLYLSIGILFRVVICLLFIMILFNLGIYDNILLDGDSINDFITDRDVNDTQVDNNNNNNNERYSSYEKVGVLLKIKQRICWFLDDNRRIYSSYDDFKNKNQKQFHRSFWKIIKDDFRKDHVSLYEERRQNVLNSLYEHEQNRIPFQKQHERFLDPNSGFSRAERSSFEKIFYRWQQVEKARERLERKYNIASFRSGNNASYQNSNKAKYQTRSKTIYY